MKTFTHSAVIFAFLLLPIKGYSSDDGYPTPPRPEIETRAVEMAGLGSQVAYGEAGVLELGGSLSFTSGDDFSQFSLSPSVGWFFVNNFRIAGMISFHTISTGDDSATYWTALAEPSYHFPFNDQVFGYLGVGAGVAYSNDPGYGTAVQPRVGVKILVGRSGVLTPSVFVAYNTIDTVSSGGSELLAIDSLTGVNIAYSVIW